jgi:hypothetical protein
MSSRSFIGELANLPVLLALRRWGAHGGGG